MRIIWEGDLSRITTVRRFECPDCGCIWDVNAGEYRREIICGKHLCINTCPTCKKEVRIDDDTEGESFGSDGQGAGRDHDDGRSAP